MNPDMKAMCECDCGRIDEVYDIIGEGINEVIVTTVSKDGVPNAAPIGIIRKNEKVFVKLFASTTCQNVIDSGYLVANITHDPMIFVMAALDYLDDGYFECMEYGNAPTCIANACTEAACTGDTRAFAFPFPFRRLKGCSCILFECQRLTDGTEPEVFSLKPVSAVIEKQVPIPVNRGFNALIEACVAATRFVLYKDVESLDVIRNSKVLVNKCGSRLDSDAFELLLQKIGVKL